MQNIWKKLVLSVVIAVVIYAVIGLYADLGDLGQSLARFSWTAFASAVGLSCINYLFRFFKWEIYLRRLGISINRLLSLEVFVAGLSMSITPGKLGEIIKSYLLYETEKIPAGRTAPIVISDRLTDMIALLVILSVGTAAFPFGMPLLAGGILLVLVVIAAILIKPVGTFFIGITAGIPLIRRMSHVLEESYESLRTLSDARTLIITSLISIVSWSCEAVGFYLVLGGFECVEPSFFRCFFIYSASTIAGALLFTPGGLGVTEGGMLGMLMKIGPDGITKACASAATILIRLATLWWGVALGLIALGLFQRRTAKKI